MEKPFQTLHNQRKIWRSHNNAICWVFYCVNDDKEVDLEIFKA
jgi:hypothetical protein